MFRPSVCLSQLACRRDNSRTAVDESDITGRVRKVDAHMNRLEPLDFSKSGQRSKYKQEVKMSSKIILWIFFTLVSLDDRSNVEFQKVAKAVDDVCTPVAC